MSVGALGFTVYIICIGTYRRKTLERYLTKIKVFETVAKIVSLNKLKSSIVDNNVIKIKNIMREG